MQKFISDRQNVLQLCAIESICHNISKKLEDHKESRRQLFSMLLLAKQYKKKHIELFVRSNIMFEEDISQRSSEMSIYDSIFYTWH